MNGKRGVLSVIGPGMLVAATGVGAGDLATGALAGSKLGTAVVWAVVAGAGLKFLLNEGVARWQLATGTTLLQGCVAHFGRPVQWFFLAYLVLAHRNGREEIQPICALLWLPAVGDSVRGSDE